MAINSPDIGSVGGVEISGAGISTTGFEGVATSLGPDVASVNLAASLAPSLNVAPDVGIQELASVNVDVATTAPETVAPLTPEPAVEPGADASTGPATPAPAEGGANLPGGPITEKPISINGVDYDPSNPPKLYQNPDGTTEYRGGVPLSKTAEGTAGATLVTEPPPGYISPFAESSPKPPGAEPAAEPTADGAAPEPTAPGTEVPPASATEAAPDVIRVGEPNDLVGSTEEDVAAAPATPDAERTARKQDLERKMSEGQHLTLAEKRELRDLNRNPEQVRADLEQKMKDGTATDEDLAKLDEIEGSEAASKLTPEQQAEKLNKDLEDMGVNLMDKLAKGEELTPEEIEKFQDLYLENNMVRAGASPDAAREAVQKVFGTRGGKERHTQAMKEVQGKIQELMALQLKLKTIPKAVGKMRETRNELLGKVKNKHNEAERATGERRLPLKREEYQLMGQLAGVNDRIVGTKHMGLDILNQSHILEQEVRRSTGVTSGIGALMEWGSAHATGVIVDLYIDAADEVDYRLGRF